MAQTANDIYLHGILAEGTDAARQIIPDPIQNGVTDTLQAFYTDPTFTQPSQGAWDTFSGLFARWAAKIGIHSWQWNSPFEQFVEPLTNGKGLELVALETPEMDAYDSHRSRMLERDFGTPHTKFLPMNFEAQRTISISETDIRTAIIEPGQMSTYTNAQVDTLLNADKIATYAAFQRELANLIKQPGTPNYHIPFADPMNPTEQELKNLSQKVRMFAQYMTIRPSALYNPAGVTTVASPDDLVVFVNPSITSNLIVNVMADAFHQENIAFQQRQITIDHFGLGDVWCVLADRRVLREARQIRTIAGMPFDPSTQSFNLSLVHRSAIGFDPFCPVMVFSGAETTVREEVKVVPAASVTSSVITDDGVAVTSIDPAVVEGPLHLVVDTHGGSITPANRLFKLPNGHRTVVTADKPDVLNSKTYVDAFDQIHLQAHIPYGTKLTFHTESLANENPDDDKATAQDKPLLTCDTGLTVAKAAPLPQDDKE